MGRGGPDTFQMRWSFFSDPGLHGFLSRQSLILDGSQHCCSECGTAPDPLDQINPGIPLGRLLHLLFGPSYCYAVAGRDLQPAAEHTFDLGCPGEWPECFEGSYAYFCGEVLFATERPNVHVLLESGDGANLQECVYADLESLKDRMSYIRSRFEDADYLSSEAFEILFLEGYQRKLPALVLFEEAWVC